MLVDFVNKQAKNCTLFLEQRTIWLLKKVATLKNIDLILFDLNDPKSQFKQADQRHTQKIPTTYIKRP